MSGAAEAAPGEDEAQYHGCMVVPDGAPANFLTLALMVPVDPLPLSDLVAGRLQRAFAAGAAVYVCSQDESIVQCMLPVLQLRADTGEGRPVQ